MAETRVSLALCTQFCGSCKLLVTFETRRPKHQLQAKENQPSGKQTTPEYCTSPYKAAQIKHSGCLVRWIMTLGFTSEHMRQVPTVLTSSPGYCSSDITAPFLVQCYPYLTIPTRFERSPRSLHAMTYLNKQQQRVPSNFMALSSNFSLLRMRHTLRSVHSVCIATRMPVPTTSSA